MNPDSIYYLFETGHKGKQEDYIWPAAGKATLSDKVFIVCDGAGSFDNGEIASKLICQFMAAKVLKFGEQKMSGELIDKLLIEARDRLITYAREYRLDTDLATTFSMLILYDQKVLMSWSGDSWIYHLRGGEILFRTEDNSRIREPLQLSEISGNNNRLQSRNTSIARGIKADNSPIYAETRWIEDVQDGDYFLLCSKGLTENVSDDDIKLLVSQNDNANIDMTESFKQLAFEKTSDNYSMYLIRVNAGTQKRRIKGGIIAIKKQTRGIAGPIFISAMIIVGLLIILFYFRKARRPDPALPYTKQATQPADVPRDDSVPNAIVMSEPVKPVPAVTDSVKTNSEKPPKPIPPPQPTPQNDNSADVQTEEKPKQTNQRSVRQKKPAGQLLVKLTTDESCKLKITNIDLDEVIDWDLSPKDNGTIYLKPGKYSIVATSVMDSSKTKTYNFNVKPGEANTRQNLHVRF